ncbi:carbohydrate kinase family protein, partial [candidate division KSB1 bacterium]|nr:carbohydrate kinase family protein [candidate division KSB1 bacterium]
NDEVYPICYLGKNFSNHVLDKLVEFKNIKLDGIKILNQKNVLHRIIYHDFENRDEVETDAFPPLQYDAIKFSLDFDAFLINFITGSDLDIDAYEKLGQNPKNLIYTDYHNLSLKSGDGTARALYRRRDWQRWIRPANILQMNEHEARVLGKMNSKPQQSDFQKFGSAILNEGIKIFNITLGSQGSWLFYQQSGNRLTSKLAPFKVKEVKDVTGCGDAFASAFLIKYLKHQDAEKAAIYANLIAARNTQFVGTDELCLLKSD